MSYNEDPFSDFSIRKSKKKKEKNISQSPSPDNLKKRTSEARMKLPPIPKRSLSPTSMSSNKIPRQNIHSSSNLSASPKSPESEKFSSPKKANENTLNNNSISFLINCLDQKYSSAYVDNDFPIVIDTLLNASADLTLRQCTTAVNNLKTIIQVTENIEMKSIQLDNCSDEIIKQVNAAMEDIHAIKKGINHVINPQVSLVVKIVSLLLYVITTFAHLLQNNFGLLDVEVDSETSELSTE